MEVTKMMQLNWKMMTSRGLLAGVALTVMATATAPAAHAQGLWGWTGYGTLWGYDRTAHDANNNFRHYLGQRYALLALDEDQGLDIEDSNYLRGAQANALAGGPVGPRDLEGVRIVSSAPGELEKGRALLIRAADNGAVEKMPEVYARALASYDCWVEQQEAEPHASHNLQNCRAQFLSNAQQLATLAPPTTARVERNTTVVMENLRTLHSVNFAFDRADLTQDARRKLDAARATLTDANNGKLIIRGFADASGPEDYNMRLSERRAENVAAYLRLPAERFETRVVGYGENSLHVPTADGVREAANRVVDISVDATRVGGVQQTTTVTEEPAVAE
jgi:OOP family OmpA-OmpF porin